MTGDLAAWGATDWSAAGLVALAILLVFFGKLQPSRSVDKLVRVLETRVMEARAEGDDWKAAYMSEHEARQIQGEQIGDLLELAKTQDQFIRSLQTKKNGES